MPSGLATSGLKGVGGAGTGISSGLVPSKGPRLYISHQLVETVCPNVLISSVYAALGSTVDDWNKCTDIDRCSGVFTINHPWQNLVNSVAHSGKYISKHLLYIFLYNNNFSRPN